jgi:hypothetical protein
MELPSDPAGGGGRRRPLGVKELQVVRPELPEVAIREGKHEIKAAVLSGRPLGLGNTHSEKKLHQVWILAIVEPGENFDFVLEFIQAGGFQFLQGVQWSE